MNDERSPSFYLPADLPYANPEHERVDCDGGLNVDAVAIGEWGAEMLLNLSRHYVAHNLRCTSAQLSGSVVSRHPLSWSDGAAKPEADITVLLADVAEQRSLDLARIIGKQARGCDRLVLGIFVDSSGSEPGSAEVFLSLDGAANSVVVLQSDSARASADLSQAKYVDSVLTGLAEGYRLSVLIGADYYDLRSVLEDLGPAALAIGCSVGPNRALDAAETAISRAGPELLRRSDKVWLLVAASRPLRVSELSTALKRVHAEMTAVASLHVVAHYDQRLAERLRVTVLTRRG